MPPKTEDTKPVSKPFEFKSTNASKSETPKNDIPDKIPFDNVPPIEIRDSRRKSMQAPLLTEESSAQTLIKEIKPERLTPKLPPTPTSRPIQPNVLTPNPNPVTFKIRQHIFFLTKIRIHTHNEKLNIYGAVFLQPTSFSSQLQKSSTAESLLFKEVSFF